MKIDNPACMLRLFVVHGAAFIILLVFSGLVGCGTSVISSNSRQVIVESQMLDARAQRLADAECAKHGRFARMAIKGDYWERNYTFDCLK
jgi:hypothetical protein